MRLEDVRIVLVGTSHPGNIGAAARAMRAMGLERLHLAAPQCDPLDAQACAQAAHGEALLHEAVVHPDLDAALSGCQLAYGLSARRRAERHPVRELRPAAEEAAARAGGEQAWVFGRERTGLTNVELDRCHYLVNIPTDPACSSLNVAQSVQLVAWELRMAAEVAPAAGVAAGPEPAGVDALEHFFGHLEEVAGAVGYLRRQNPELTMRRMRNLFRRAQPADDELRMLRGLFNHILDHRRWSS